MLLVQGNKVAKCDGECSRVGYFEGIEAQFFLEPRHDQGETERVEIEIQQGEGVGEPRELARSFARDALELRTDCGS
jgi:hypothetical protein